MTDTADDRTDEKGPDKGADKGERIAKVLARAGVASRRDVERMIADGRVRLDGKAVTGPAFNVSTTAGITVDGQPVASRANIQMWRYYKPRGVLTTHKDPEGRPTVFERLPSDMPRVVSVGRLDMNTEGLLLLTNDGELARWMELPKTGWIREYRVRVYGRVNERALEALKDGVVIDGMAYGPIEASVEKHHTSNAWLNVKIAEGKNREVRRVMLHLGLEVNRLVRVAYGPFHLGRMERSEVVPVQRNALAKSIVRFMNENPNARIEAPKANDRAGWAKAKPKKSSPVRAGKRRAARAGVPEKTEGTKSTAAQEKRAYRKSGHDPERGQRTRAKTGPPGGPARSGTGRAGAKGFGPKGSSAKGFGAKGSGTKGSDAKGAAAKGRGLQAGGAKSPGPRNYGPKNHGPKSHGPKRSGPKGSR